MKSQVEVVTTASTLISNFGEDPSSLDVGKCPILHDGNKIRRKKKKKHEGKCFRVCLYARVKQQMLDNMTHTHT